MAPLLGFLGHGLSLKASFDRDVARRRTVTGAVDLVTDEDLARLPALAQQYLRIAGVVGQPHVFNLFARMHGRIRNGQRGRWMPLAAEQFDFFDPPARFFYFTSSMFGVPLQGYHRYADASASMQVKAASLVPVARLSGPAMTRSETVTLFNDMCLLAPATLLSPAVTWAPGDARTVRAVFTNAGCAIGAELVFNQRGELVDFRSDDRCEAAPGGALRQRRWSTPLGAYRSFGAARLASAGEGRWGAPGDEYAYIELVIDEVRYNAPPHPAAASGAQ